MNSLRNNNSITNYQMMILFGTFIVTTADIVLPSFIADEVGRDSWISVIISTGIAFILATVIIKLSKLYPKKNLLQIFNNVYGKFFGFLVGAIFWMFLFDTEQGIMTEFYGIMNDTTNSELPRYILLGTALLVSTYAYVKGIYSIFRVNELLFSVGIITLLLIVGGNIDHIDFTNYLPILENGWLNIFQGAYLVNGWFFEIIIVFRFIPHMSDPTNFGKYLYGAVILVGTILLGGTLIVSVFGELTKYHVYPAFDFVTYADFGQYIQRLDVLFVCLWMGGILIKIIVIHYCMMNTAIELFRLKENCLVYAIIGIIVIAVNIMVSADYQDVSRWLKMRFTLESNVIAGGVPLFTLIVATMKKNIGKN